jgi:protein-ribulosamine 3-kinase
MQANPLIRILEDRWAEKITTIERVAGGSINDNYRLFTKNRAVFCKVNSATKFPQLLEKEKRGLDTLASYNIRTPAVVDFFISGDQQILILDWIQPGKRTTCFWKRLGEQVAGLHQVSNKYFGLDEDNYMGSVPQQNEPILNWTDFFINRRLVPMVEKCHLLLPEGWERRFEKLYGRLPHIFPGSPPALLHGDLWNGNLICDINEEPVFVDPAVYFGHPAMDVGMTMLFGGFDKVFYDAYQHHAVLSLDEKQCELCNLYPLLIHLYLFGRNYLPSIENLLFKYS